MFFIKNKNNKYIYSYTDHVGNVRLSYTKNGSGAEIFEENNFYSFGLKHEGYNAIAGNPSYNYQYSGKELQTETGWSDFGARMYMPDIGRWGVIDPLAETSRRVNPYNYALNNPVMFIDPDGRKAYSPEPIEVFQSSAGAWGYFAGGGSATFGSFAEFLGQDNLFYQSASGGGGGGNATKGSIYSFAQGQGVGFTGIYAQMVFSFLSNQIASIGGVDLGGFHFVQESITPNIYRHTLNAFLNGKPSILHYDGDKSRQAQRRKESTGTLPTKPGMHKDEYPYASTFEGGKGALVEYVPASKKFFTRGHFRSYV